MGWDVVGVQTLINDLPQLLQCYKLDHFNIYRVVKVPPALWPKRLLFNGNATNTLNVFCKHIFS